MALLYCHYKKIQYVYAYAYVFIAHQARKLLNKENKAKPHILHHVCIFKDNRNMFQGHSK
jgi:hypothetical protein